MNRLATIIATGLATVCAAAIAPAQFDRNPGSVLIYPVHRSGPGWFTFVCVTNTDTEPTTPVSLGGATNVHFEYVNVTPNPNNPFLPCGCEIFDRIEYLTPADTMCVLTSCHNAYRPGGQEGYLVISAEDPSMPPGFAWDHDHLIGSSIVMGIGGIAYSTNALPIEALVPNPAVAPDPLQFDGVNYEQLPAKAFLPSFIAGATPSISMANFSGNAFTQNTLLFTVWNDNEYPLSTTLVFSCWFDQPLTRVSPLFSQAFLASTNNDPTELDITCDGVGDVETGWFCVESIMTRAAGQPCYGSGANEGQEPPTTMPPMGPPQAGGAVVGWTSASGGGAEGNPLQLGVGASFFYPMTYTNGEFRTP